MCSPSPEVPTLAVRNTEVDGRPSDIHVVGNRIAAVLPHEAHRRYEGRTMLVDGSRTAALPGLMNGHTHTAMAMLRSYADDMPLMPWLEEKIWPFEAG